MNTAAPDPSAGLVDYTDIANRAQDALGRGVNPSTAKAIIEAYMATLSAPAAAVGDARTIMAALLGKLQEVAMEHNDRSCDYDVCVSVRNAFKYIYRTELSETDDDDENEHVITALSRLLAEIAVILKGPEPDLTRWSYHDLPDMVRALKEATPAAPVGGFVVDGDYALPCDVKVWPATTITKGCKLSTLIKCIQLRDGPDLLANADYEQLGELLKPLSPAAQSAAKDGVRVQRWPFVESPGDFTERLRDAMNRFPLIGAVRHVLIEDPPTIATTGAGLVEAQVKGLVAQWMSVAHGLRVLGDEKAAEATDECAAELAEAIAEAAIGREVVG